MGATIDRLAIVTGGSRGLGLAICDEFERQGFTVRELSRSGQGERHVDADLRDPAAAAAAVTAMVGAIDRSALSEVVVVSNAATIEPIAAVGSSSLADLLENLHVNMVSAIAILATLLALLDEVSGRKVMAHVTSGAARSLHAGLALYAASKAGMEQFMRVTALEQLQRPRPFAGVLLDPGAIDTGMQRQLREAAGRPLVQTADWQRRHAAGELATTAEMARRIVALLTSPELRPGSHIHVPSAAQWHQGP